ncbi:MAG: response regulator [Acidobacteriota bacterium]
MLVIEDDPETRQGVQQLLAEEGFGVELASDGAEALALLRQASPPTLILLDLQMPGMSGWEFRREQLSEPSLSRIPVVLMTGYGEYDASLACLKADGHLQKPVRSDELHGVLERFR